MTVEKLKQGAETNVTRTDYASGPIMFCSLHLCFQHVQMMVFSSWKLYTKPLAVAEELMLLNSVD
jgi:hypothetical protein